MRNKGLQFVLAGVFVFASFCSLTEAKYEANWQSLDKRPTPQWFTDAKFGILIHWGLYSVPSFGESTSYAEWYWAWLKGSSKRQEQQFHLKTYGPDFTYFDFAPLFKAELYDPNQWAEIFLKSGAKYIILTSKHHEGFCLWPSKEANQTWGRAWNSVDIGPKRDLLGDLTEAVRKKGMKMGLYYSLYEWYNPLYLTDKKKYVDEHMVPQFKDVVTRYKPSIIFSDGEWDLPSSEWKSAELLEWLFNESSCRDEVAINDRWGKECRGKHGGYYETEYGAGFKDANHPWEETRGMGYSFGYNRNEPLKDYKSAKDMILMLIDMVSRGGNLLIDIGPAADGRIPVIMEERLIQIGQWLNVNGEAIYGTKMWNKTCQWSAGQKPEIDYSKTLWAKYDTVALTTKSADGKAVIEVFFTAKDYTLYAITPKWPGKELVLDIPKPSDKVTITLLGREGNLEWKYKDGKLIIDLSSISMGQVPCSEAYVFKIKGYIK